MSQIFKRWFSGKANEAIQGFLISVMILERFLFGSGQKNLLGSF